MKERILREIRANDIRIYQFPENDEDDDEDDEEFSKLNDELRTSVPFAVVGSNTVHEVKGKKVWSVNFGGNNTLFYGTLEAEIFANVDVVC